MEVILPPLLLFEPRLDRGKKPAPADGGPQASANPLRCSACRTAITVTTERIEMGGAHAHRFRNPLGLEFEIGCFRSAPGCAVTGAATGEHSWFSGFAWRVALCGRCERHLGWQYEGGSSSFYGLILTRLTAGDDA